MSKPTRHIKPRVAWIILILCFLASMAKGQDLELGLPWRTGKSWYLTGGPHHQGSDPSKPFSSLDFASNGDRTVCAMADGKIIQNLAILNYDTDPDNVGENDWQPCPAILTIDHDNGYYTIYQHVDNKEVLNKVVNRGDSVARESNTNCWGTVGQHLHVGLIQKVGDYSYEYVSLNGRNIGGYTVHEDDADPDTPPNPYDGYLVNYYDVNDTIYANVNAGADQFVANTGIAGPSGVVDEVPEEDPILPLDRGVLSPFPAGVTATISNGYHTSNHYGFRTGGLDLQASGNHSLKAPISGTVHDIAWYNSSPTDPFGSNAFGFTMVIAADHYPGMYLVLSGLESTSAPEGSYIQQGINTIGTSGSDGEVHMHLLLHAPLPGLDLYFPYLFAGSMQLEAQTLDYLGAGINNQHQGVQITSTNAPPTQSQAGNLYLAGNYYGRSIHESGSVISNNSTATIKYGADVVLSAANRLQFSQGFTVEQGATLVAQRARYAGPAARTGILEQETEDPAMSVLPNPATEQATIRYHIPAETMGMLEISDMSGRTLRQIMLEANTVEQRSFAWDLRDSQQQRVSEGIYIATLHYGDFQSSVKIMVK